VLTAFPVIWVLDPSDRHLKIAAKGVKKMKLRMRELAAFVLVALVTAIVVQAQSLNPSYLSEMPAPVRILAEIKGKDVEDTGERQMGAFMALIKIMDDMAWGLEHRYVDPADTRKSSPDELRIRIGYQTAYADLWHKVKNKEGHVYDHDLDLLNEMLQKLFSENFRAKYFQADRNAQAGYKAFQQRMYGPPQSQPSTTSAARTSASNQPASPSGASGRSPGAANDPSIAKARAANIDTKVLGLALGEPLLLPSCGSFFDVVGRTAPTQTCVQPDLPDVFGSGSLTAEELRTKGLFISFPSEACPSWMADCGVSAMTYDGLLVAIDIKTKGHTVDQAVVKDLRDKYGPPTLVKPIEVTPKVGNPFKANHLEWMLPGLHVVYDVVIKGENEGEVTDVDSGDIGFETEAAYHRRLAKEKAKPKPKL
jgi:hypothetical protein